MAAKTFYLLNGISSNVHQAMSETGPGTDANSTPNYGFNTGTTAAGNFASADAQTMTSSWSTTAQPDGSIVTTQAAGDAWRTPVPLKGTFAAGTWSFQTSVINSLLTTTPKGKSHWRLFRGSNTNGSSATEIGGGTINGTEVQFSNLAQVNSTGSKALGAQTLNNEYLFVQLGWEITAAASGKGASTSKAIIRVGSTASQFTTPNFTPDTSQIEHSETANPTSVNVHVDDVAWTGPQFGATTDGNRAQFITAPSIIDQISERLQGLAPPSFQNIPDTATVDQIVFRSDLDCDNASAIKFTEVYLIVAGSISGNNKATLTHFPTTMGIFEWEWSPGSGDTLPTVAQLKASNFGLSLRAKNELGNGEIGRIDQMEGYVIYTSSGGVKDFIQIGIIPFAR